MATPTGIARSLQRTLEIEAVGLEVAERQAGAIPLLNPRRLEILLTAAAYPGVHLRSASRLLLAPLPSLRFHVQRLTQGGVLRVLRDGPRANLFVSSLWRPHDERFLALWQDPFDRRVIRIVAESARVPESRLRRQVLPDARSLRPALERLTSAHVVRVRGSRDRSYSATSIWKRFEAECRDGGGGRLEKFLGVLRAQGLRPMLEEANTTRARISVDGPRSRIRFVLPLNPLDRPD